MSCIRVGLNVISTLGIELRATQAQPQPQPSPCTFLRTPPQHASYILLHLSSHESHTTPHQFCPLCPQDGALARRVGVEVFQVYIIARMQLIEERVEVSAEQRMKEQLEHELSRLRSLDATERQTTDAVQRVHDMLTLKCPRCAAAVFDFDGCFALKCPRCGCGFCAWCFKDCQADAHAHVRTCTRRPAQRDALFPARGGEDAVRDVFRPHHMRLHRQEVSKYLQELPSEVRKGVRQRLVQELKELQLYEE